MSAIAEPKSEDSSKDGGTSVEEIGRHAKVAEPFYGVNYQLSEGLFGGEGCSVRLVVVATSKTCSEQWS